MTLIVTVIVIALAFEYINGFHDTANSIATVVSTKVLTPRQAVMLAACTNLCGAFLGTAVAKTITGGLVDAGVVSITSEIIICALLGAIVWNLITWWLGLPSSSSHALIGGLCGAALAASNFDWTVLKWNVVSAASTHPQGLWRRTHVRDHHLFLLDDATHRKAELRSTATRQRGFHGLKPRLQRRPKNH